MTRGAPMTVTSQNISQSAIAGPDGTIAPRAFLAASLLAVLVLATSTSAQVDTQPSEKREIQPAFASPESIKAGLIEARANPAGLFPYSPVSLIDPAWRDLNRAAEESGLTLGLAYTAVYQHASNGPGVRDAAGGDVDLFGEWRLLGDKVDPNRGALLFAAEDRHELFTSIPPASLGSEIGSAWKTTDGFNEEVLTFREVYWQQHFGGDRLIARLGKIDAKQYYASNYWASDNKYFMNNAFSGFPLVAYPSKGLGMNLTAKLGDQWYLSAGAQDGQGTATRVGGDTLFGDLNLFSAAEIEFTPAMAGIGKGAYRLMGWYRDAGTADDTPYDKGFAFSCDQHVGDHLVPFFKAGVGKRNVTGIEAMISAGVGWEGKALTPSDIIGVAASWGKPADHDRDAQYAIEAFYRLQVARDIQLTVGYQAVFEPINAPGDDVVGVFEVRWRIAF
jgi:hypothetical protein